MFLLCFWRRQWWAIFGTKSASKCSILEAQKWPSWSHFHALGRLRAICWRCREGPRWAQNLKQSGSKTVLRGEEKVTKTVGFYTVFGAAKGGLFLEQNRLLSAPSWKPKNGPLGPIFTLLDASGQFVGEVGRGQDGPRI